MIGGMRERRAPVPASLRTINFPAPVGGLNTIDAGGTMPPSDCVLLYNMVAAEYGLRSRLGYSEWCTGLGYPTRTIWAQNTVYAAGAIVINGPNLYATAAGGTSSATGTGPAGNTPAADGTVTDWSVQAAVAVRSVLPFTGKLKNGTDDKLFGCTTDGIYDCTTSSQIPSRSIAFAASTADSGWGIGSVFVNVNGDHFLLYCDEENGYYTYTEATATWAKVAQATSTAWVAATAYTINVSRVLANGNTYLCKTSGNSAASPATGPSGTGAGIVDGTCTWDYEPTISGKDPATFAAVVVWANRVWFIEKDTPNAWYTGIGALYGPVTKFAFGARFRAGGDLRGLFNWTIDGGSGVTNSLVAVSGGGDVEIYQGTDPSSASTFGLKGVWSLGGGGVPYGRRIATDFGGDLLFLTTVGVVPLSRLTQGNPVFDRSQYATAKIANTFNQLAIDGRAQKGWQIRIHPQDNTLLINVPQPDGTTIQLAMSLATRGWSQYRDLPTLYSMEAWGGNLYFGTSDGRVCKNAGYLDGVTLASGTYTPVQWEVLTAFRDMGSASKKRVESIRPQFIYQGGAPTFAAAARYDYDFSELAAVTAAAASGSSWDSGVWDSALWGGAYTNVGGSPVRGATGFGTAVGIILRGTATSRTSLVCIDVMLTTGGPL